MEITTEMINEELFGEGMPAAEPVEDGSSEENTDLKTNEKEPSKTKEEFDKTDRVMDESERRRNAALRRANERRDMESKLQERVDAAYASAYRGQVNPYTGKPILTEQDFHEYQKAVREKTFESAGIPTTALDEYISEHPAIKRANEMSMRAEAEMREAEMERGQQEMQRQLKLISAIDPDIKSIDDLIASPNAERFNDLLSKGNSMYDAYRLANIDKLINNGAARVKQETLNRINGKGHMTPMGSSNTSDNGVEVPSEVADMYRSLMPELSSEEIRKDYNKRRKK